MLQQKVLAASWSTVRLIKVEPMLKSSSFWGLSMFSASLLFLAACQSADVNAAPAPKKPEPQASTPLPAQPVINPETPDKTAAQQSGGSSTGAAKSGEKQKEEDKRRNIPQRKFQLNDLKKAEIKIDDHKFSLWVMDTYDKRMEGMMFVENSDFKDNEGMIFLFKEPEYQRFWMRNTLVPLDIAYVSKDRRINSTYTMKALDEVGDYSSFAPSDVVIELRAGMFRKLSIGRTSRVTLPAGLVAKE